jgi:L-threonylcarbamoyladenylate synthase
LKKAFKNEYFYFLQRGFTSPFDSKSSLFLRSMTEALQKALEVLKSGGIILYPTDTIWGIGCDATKADAVEKVYALKNRVDSKSMIVLLDEEAKLNRFVKDVPGLAWDILEMSEEPLTIIYDDARNLAPNVIAEDGSVGIRVTHDAFCQQLIRKFGRPIVSTSANISGEMAPRNFSEIAEEIKKGVDYVVAYRQLETRKAQASKIIKLSNDGRIKILR